MPVLPEEPELFPLDLFEAEAASQDDELTWWMAHTRPRQEKALARELLIRQIPYYLPCHGKRTKTAKGVVVARIPSFSGYVFLRTTREQRWKATSSSTKRIASLYEVKDQQRIHADLLRVRHILGLGKPVSVVAKLEPGTQVTLRDGPMMGMTGQIIKQAGAFKFVVMVDFIQRGLSITVDGSMLGIIDPK